MRSRWVFILCYGSIFAMPQDPHVLNQDASISLQSPEVMEIVTSESAMIEWKDFSIDTRETVRFSQPSPEAVVLNRVIGTEMSQIFGKLEANGKVLLINPNGVLFGKEARIDTGSFIASTLDLQGDFFARNKKMQFEGTSTAQIINLGSIVARGGDLALIASDINQQGHLNASNGSVALIGTDYSKDFECQFPDENRSRITHSGHIASPGGHVHLMANEIYVFKESTIDTSSPFSGGEILIGAGLQGKDPAFTHAEMIWVEEGARFFADPLEQGPVGRVIIYSDGITDFAGHISAKGGFAECSGGYLSYRGLADLRSDHGENGTLLLDPTDIMITGADVNSSFAAGFLSFPFSCVGANCLGSTCSGASQVSIRFITNAPFLASTISSTTILTQLGLGHVVIDSTTGGLGTGNITWAAGFDLTVAPAAATANDLILNASGNVMILSNVQNPGPGTGRMIINKTGAGTVDINTPGNIQKVSFGSNDGLTEICAPRATVNVRASLTMNGVAQVGFYTPVGGTSTGPIRVCCQNLNVEASSPSILSGAQIGHGQIDGQTNNVTVAAPIDVLTSGNIVISGGAASIQSHAKIGHGVNSALGLGDFTGNINVQANGVDVGIIPAFRMFGSSGNAAIIGHGTCIGAPITNLGGTIQVQVPNGSILMESNSPGGGSIPCMIGHGNTVGSTYAFLNGDIFVCCGGDLTLRDLDANLFGQIGIGHESGGGLATYAGNTLITVGGNITVEALPPRGPSLGGAVYLGILAGVPVLTQTTQIICGGNFTATLNDKFFFVGSQQTNAAAETYTRIATGGNFTFFNQNGRTRVTANADLAIAVGGDFTVTSGAGPLSSNNVTSFNGFVAGRPNDTRIYAGGNIIGINGPIVQTILGNANAFGNPNYNVDFRAGGNIQLPNNLDQAGNIFLEADTFLPAGALWNYTGGVITSICGLPTIPILCTLACPSPLAGRPTGMNSLPLTPNGRGCFSAVTAPSTTTFLPAVLSTTTGPITIHSAPLSTLGATCDLNIGNDVTLTTTSGNLEVFGTVFPGPCVRANSFFDVTINQNICTRGSVLIAANHNITMAPGSSIGGPACGALIPSSVTLIVDNQFPLRPLIGPGGFFMDATAVINSTGPVRIFTALQNINVINGLINGVMFLPGTPFICTNEEIWCSYFCDITCPMSGVPFTISYKNCLQQATQQATIIIDEFLVDLHPYNEYPGWMMRFWIDYADQYILTLYPEPYMLRRRHLNVINHPKTWAQLIEDTHPRPLENAVQQF